MKDTDQEENPDPRKDRICRWECLKVTIRAGFFTRKNRDIHQPNTLAKRGGKRIQDVHRRGDPFCESIVTILGLVKCRDLFSKDREDCLGGIAGLKAGKERMRDQILLCLPFVGFQCSVENRHKIGLRGRCGGGSGHDTLWRREGWLVMSK
jgi:hypothetical protein